MLKVSMMYSLWLQMRSRGTYSKPLLLMQSFSALSTLSGNGHHFYMMNGNKGLIYCLIFGKLTNLNEHLRQCNRVNVDYKYLKFFASSCVAKTSVQMLFAAVGFTVEEIHLICFEIKK